MRKRQMPFRNYLTMAILMLAFAASIWLLLAPSGAGREAGSAEPRPGREAPAVEGVDTAGKRLSLGDYRGQPVLVNFWASWCKPCAKEMPIIDEAYRGGEAGFRLISVNVGETKGTVNAFLAENGISFPALVDATGRTSARYRVTGLPATFVVDAEGKLSRSFLGELTGREQLEDLLFGDD